MMKVNPKFPDYEISDDGRVFRVICRDGRATPGEIFGRILKSGYRQFSLTDCDGGKAQVRANRLIAETFLGEPPSLKHHCAHNDGDRLNNRLDNLRWATAKENAADMELHGRKCRGSRMPTASLTDDQVTQARLLFTGKKGEIRALARQFGVPYSVMGRVLRNESYCNGCARRAAYRKLSQAQRLEIVEALVSKGVDEANNLAAKYDRDSRYVASLLRDRRSDPWRSALDQRQSA